MFNGITVDFRLAFRRLLASPLFTVFAVLSLATGVAITTAVYSIVDSIFLNDDLGIREPDRVAFVVDAYDGRFQRSSIADADFDELRAAQTSFIGLSASAPLALTVTTPASTEGVAAELVDGNYFPTMGVEPVIGRTIQVSDNEAGAHVVVLSERYWRRRFGASTDVRAQQVRIAGQSFEIIGVAPMTFNGAAGSLPGMGTSLWIPRTTEGALAASPSAGGEQHRRRLLAFGRLAPTTTEAAASSELASIAARLDAERPPAAQRGGVTERPWKVRSIGALATDDSTLRRFGLTLVGLVGLVLVVACTNLANLVLSRGVGRRQEFAVRCALGASRWRLVREQCAESLLIAVMGGAASYIVFQGLTALLNTDFNLALPMGQRWTISIRPSLNQDALVMAGVGLLLSLVVFGLEPALQLTRTTDLTGELAASGGSVGDLKAPRQRALLRWQIAVAAGFFIIATMFVRFTIAEVRHDSGIGLDRMAVAMLNPMAPGWDQQRRTNAVARVLDRARGSQMPVLAASAGFPFGNVDPLWLTISVPGAPRSAVRATGMAATPLIFRALDIPVLQGRPFDDRDHAASAPVAVLSQFTARQLFGTVDGLGRQVVVQSQQTPAVTATVVGVVRDTDVRRMFGDPAPFVYLPLAQRPEPATTIVARASDASTALRSLNEALRTADPDFPVDVMGTGRSVLTGPFQLLRSAGVAAIGLGAITLFLAMIGLFGIQSHLVSRRTREIGVRIAFGATRGQIQRMVLKDGYRPVVEGLALGLFIGLAGRAIVRTYLELDIDIVDPWIVMIVPVPLLLAACCACYLPARRASTIDPNIALRHL